MSKKAVSGIMLTLLLIGTLALAFNIQPVKAEPGTIYIRADGSVEGTDKIQRDGDVYTFADNIYNSIVVERSNIIVDGSGYTLQGSGSGYGFDLTSVNDVTIQNTDIKNFYRGVYLESSSHSTVSGNNIADNWDGIYLDSSNNNTISGNTITNNNLDGIYLYGSSGNTISGNTITNNNGDGICLSYSSGNTISGNTITNNNLDGIRLYGSSNNNTISGNTITNNNLDGIRLYGSSNNNTISGNTITNNNVGVHMDANEDILTNNVIAGNIEAGIEIWGYNNSIFHNSLFNKEQVVVGWGMNVWDDGYPSGGNYWSDYVDKDQFSGPNQDQSGSDGIGDEPYVIDENNRDRYPLMAPVLIHEHDLASSVWAPDSLITGTSTTLEATVYNLGLNNETDVELKLLVNDAVVDPDVISELASGSFSTLNHSWTPTVEDIYNVTAYVTPVPGELTALNNIMSIMVNVYTPPTEPTRIYLSPSEIHTNVGSVFTIDVMVANVEDLYAWQIMLYFNNTILNCTEDMIWLPADHVFAGKAYMEMTKIGLVPSWAYPRVPYILYACSLVGAEPTFTGTGTLCQINFTGIALGTSYLEFSSPLRVDTLLEDSEGELIDFTVVDGEVIEYFTEDLNHDGKVNIQDISTAARAFGSYPSHLRWEPIADINKDNKVNIKDLTKIARNFGKTAP